MDILDDMGVSKLSAKVFFKKVNYSFNNHSGFCLNQQHKRPIHNRESNKWRAKTIWSERWRLPLD